jgi:hypothetical protein
VLEELTRALSAVAPRADFSVVTLHNPRRSADAQIFHRGGTGSAAAGGDTLMAACEALTALPEVASVDAFRDSLTVRFTDARVAELGAQLEAGNPHVLDARELLAGTTALVNFCDANPTKALHVGHLRNIALGQALAGALTAAGAEVIRQSQVSDYCRSMGEALAGYMELPEHVEPRSLGLKSDHFVGECFGRYAAKLAARAPAQMRADGGERPSSRKAGNRPSPRATGDQPSPRETGDRPFGEAPRNGEEDPALSREAVVRHDLADELLERLNAGDPEIVARWRMLREWALAGQNATLAALGVKLDRFVYESDSRPITRWLLDRGLAGGVLTRTEDGSVVYETREAEYPRLLLARSDGFPTQHLRTIALWHSLRETLAGTRSIELVGEEWHAYVRYHDRLVYGVGPSQTDPRGSAAAPIAPGETATVPEEIATAPGETATVPAKIAAARGEIAAAPGENAEALGESATAHRESERPRPHPHHHPSCNVMYGMVTVEGGAVKSSDGRPPLVDGMLERLAASQELRELAARSEGRFTPQELAAVIALGFYLGRPTRKPVDLSLTEMLELRGGVGWELARAAVEAWSPRHDGPPDPAPEEQRYRRTVLQSQVHRRLLERAVEQLDVYELARFYGHVSRRYLAAEADARTARAMRTLLAAGLGSLGLPGSTR